MKNYYEVLEVDKNASSKVIKGVYKLHIKENHPDLFQGEERLKAEEKIKELNEAYEVLSDESKRKEYNKLLLQEFEDKLVALKEENSRLKEIMDEKEKRLMDNLEKTAEYEEDESVTLENNQKYMSKLQSKEWAMKIIATICIIIAASVGIYKATGYNLFKAFWNAFVATFR